jgi:hypothetical protein
MDWRVRAIEHTAAVPLDGDFAVGVVLRRRTRDRRESAVDAANRRAVHADTVLRDPEDDPVAVRARVRGQRETDPPVDAANGTGGDLSEAAVVGSGARTSHLSVSSKRTEDQSAESGLVQRHHLHSLAPRFRLSGGGDGLVQPVCAGLGSLDFHGDVVLPGGSGLGLAVRTTRYFQYRSGVAVHQRGVHGSAGGSGHRHQHGRARESDRQHFHRTLVADGKVRRGLSEGLSGRAGNGSQSEKVFCFLQSRTSASSIGLPDASGDLLSMRGMRRRGEERGYAVGRRNWRSSFLGVPGAKFFCGNPGKGTKKEKRSKKERNGRPVETVATDGNPHTPRIPTAAWKAKTAFHSSHEAQQQFHHLFERQRYTLNQRIFGPKNGEHFTLHWLECVHIGRKRARS